MKNLDKPGHSALGSYNACISKVRDVQLKTRLRTLSKAVVTASTEYDDAAARGDLHQFSGGKMTGTGVSRQEMEAVYTQRMAKALAPGRAIYDDLLGAAELCPLCCHRDVSSLDHFMPKAHFPLLAVTPLNLVPVCDSCNKAKLDTIARHSSSVPLHPYFDNIDGDKWLVATVVQAAPAALHFSVQSPSTWSTVLRARVYKHFEGLALARLYSVQAAVELVSIRHGLAEIFDASGPEGVRADLQLRARSCRAAQLNGWRTAAYEAWSVDPWFFNGGFQ